uniref:NADH:quinone oxidoreductase/Mrp antiporter membrane subunit domain-containing protein n=1 Tax=Setaria viridis TaxID=4556 RepID=A0A4U6V6E8_SETVI|nr:hypothetical protein SEVIR_3G011050v2 [Setaria viridis]
MVIVFLGSTIPSLLCVLSPLSKYMPNLFLRQALSYVH